MMSSAFPGSRSLDRLCSCLTCSAFIRVRGRLLLIDVLLARRGQRAILLRGVIAAIILITGRTLLMVRVHSPDLLLLFEHPGWRDS